MGTLNTIPTWAPRVTQAKIRQFYETDAKGIYDDDLIEEVGYSLLARCQSFVEAKEAVAGRARCPCCSTIIPHTGRKDDLLRCTCGWELTWGEYFKTIQHKQLSGAEPVFEQFNAFIKALPSARTPQEKVLLIDCLIHGFHWYYKTNGPTRPVAVNLIEGSMGEVVAFLDNLNYGEKSTPETAENLAQWNKNIEANRNWYPSRRKA